ncbi:MAG: aspartate aminotransferase family protein [Myxococcales bacterium]|nr:aspartate aminotransferase family protein [Myxococcales bacterium]
MSLRLPESRTSKDALWTELLTRGDSDVAWRDGRTWAYVYDPGPDAEELSKRAFVRFLDVNALDPTAFPSALRLENEVVSMAAQHVNAPPGAVGSFTSGGTESIILAVKAARDAWRASRSDRTHARPNLVLPETAHAAFHKAAHYLDCDVKNVPVDPATYRAVPALIEDAIDDHTCLAVGSAPQYPHGVIDPIEALAAIASARNVRFHVDGCVGGFMLPFWKRLGADIPAFDFTIPGVTSMSIDLHKYGFAPKGASVILHRSAALREHQLYACSTWAGYTIVNNTVQSTRSAGPMAAAWATLRYLGSEGYLELARRMMDATARVRAGLLAIPGLAIMGDPDMNMLAFTTTDGTSVFHIADEMKERGWTVQPQLSYGPHRANIHLSVNATAPELVDPMLAALAESTVAARTLPSGHLAAAVVSLLGGKPSLDDALFMQLMSFAGVKAGADGPTLPSRMAGINEALDALPPKAREALLVKFANLLYST